MSQRPTQRGLVPIPRTERYFSPRATLLAFGLIMVGVGPQAGAWQAAKSTEPYKPTADERAKIESGTAELARAIDGLKSKTKDADALADVEVAHKAASWALRYGDFFEARDVARALKALDKGLERARALGQGKKPWAEAAGGAVRGYRSVVDGSVQPYAVIAPASKGPEGVGRRLDVVLHGRDARISEVRFFDAHDGKPAPADETGIVLHVYGRGNNAYRWAGETDVFEAIDAVRRNYRVDDSKIVLRGFSMGGAGAWHLALHHPSRWSSAEAGAGFTETVRYAKLVDPSEITRKLLTIYDPVDYALNAFDVPIAGYGGENDSQAQASLNILEALKKLGVPMKTEGLVTVAEGPDFRRIVGKGMGHAVDKESARLLKAFHDERIAQKADHKPIRFVTYTLKYPRVGWLSIHRLSKHYDRTTLDAEVKDGVAVIRTTNVEILSVARNAADKIRLDGVELPLKSTGDPSGEAYFGKSAGRWQALTAGQVKTLAENKGREKAPGIQGPVDDAFTGPFLCVRGTGKADNPKVQAWTDARLKRFVDEWGRWMRGDLVVKDDSAVTEQDLAGYNLILFGDAGSNSWIKSLAPQMGLSWGAKELRLRGDTYPAADHAPVLIQANPRNPRRYVVVNTGHSFGAREYKGTNALLYPHLPDFAVYQIGLDEKVVKEGFYGEGWE